TTEDRKCEEKTSQARTVKNQPIPYVEQNQSNLQNLPNPSIERQLTPVSDKHYPLERQQGKHLQQKVDRNDPAYYTIPPISVPNSDIDDYTWHQFNKKWDKSQNYTGKAYDILDDKIRYFLHT
ncbi:hypothetical protein GcM3_075035, partial [Golovinomyces cichoracearum]